jgi:CDP-paratose 2-epimerase
MNPTTLVTGGVGFIGTNLGDRLLARGDNVVLFDNLSRPGSHANLAWLERRHGNRAGWFVQGDVRDQQAVAEVTATADRIVHLAGQTAVTTALVDPRDDFEANAVGTFNVLEGARLSGRDPAVLYASTNKVYGALERFAAREETTRYRLPERPQGIGEDEPLDPVSPYGCSKAAGEIYVRDYHRSFGLRTVVLRQSCVYGARQLGRESQGWVAWFALAAMRGEKLRIFGDGKQVRDLLWVDDLLEVYEAAFERIETVAGDVFNIGGGEARSLSVWLELRPILEQKLGRSLTATHHAWRLGEQKVFISDNRKAARLLDWRPRMEVDEGISRLVAWAREAATNRG